MIFKEYEFASKFDLDRRYVNYQLTINDAAKQLEILTHLLLEKDENNEPVYLNYRDQYGRYSKIKFDDINEMTWNRNQYEIKQLLYRPKINGKNQKQFSIKKALEKLNIYEPKTTSEEYGQYIQLLYFFYIVHYFVFPKINLFQWLERDHYKYGYGFDENSHYENYFSFVFSQLLSARDVFDDYLIQLANINNSMSLLSNFIQTSHYLNLPSNINDVILDAINEVEVETNRQSLFNRLVGYLYSSSMFGCANDYYNNLIDHQNLFYFNVYEPPLSMQNKYILLDDIDEMLHSKKLEEYLKSDELIHFCKQNDKKLEVRDRIKFIESNAVKFFYQLLDYDFVQTNESYDGFLLQEYKNGYRIYALSIATVIITYNEMVNKMRMKLVSGQKEVTLSLKSLLFNHLDSRLPFLPAQFFMFSCHLNYVAMTRPKDFDQIWDEYFFKETMEMKIFKAAFCFDDLDNVAMFLDFMLEYL